MQYLISRSDILKSEANPKSKICINAPQGTKIGDVVKYDVRNQYLIALSDEQHGKVLVQPQDCVMDLSMLTLPSDVKFADLQKQGDVYGIQYVGTPKQGEQPTKQPLSVAESHTLSEV